MAQTEMQPYEIIENISDTEIRFYPSVMMAKHKSKNPGAGFGKLFNYISGNNNTETKIIKVHGKNIKNFFHHIVL